MAAVSAGSPPVLLGPPEKQAWHSPALSAKHLGSRRGGVKRAARAFADRARTRTVPFIPGWMSQKYVTVPAFVKRTVIGLVLGPAGAPLCTLVVPS